MFEHGKPTVNNLGYSFREISHHEYISCFGYDSNFNFQILDKENLVDQIRDMMPMRTTHSLVLNAHNYLNDVLQRQISAKSEQYGVDFSSNVFLTVLLEITSP